MHNDSYYFNTLEDWSTANPREKIGKETYRLIDAWQNAAQANNNATLLEEVWEAWWSDRSKPAPDLLQIIAHYGYSRLLTRGWKSVPIKVDRRDATRWNDDRCGLGASLREFRELFQGGIVGGFFQEAVKDPTWLGQTLVTQLAARLARLNELANIPREAYTPVYLNMAFEHGAEEKRTWFAEQERYDEEDRLAEPADLYELLYCFSWGLQKFRLFSTSLNEPEFGLPNTDVFNALMKVSVNNLVAQLAYVEPKIKDILAWVWDKDPTFLSDIDYAPESFWWRHVSEHMEMSQADNGQQRN